ncbi:MAG: hypothetical protein CVU05_01810 [Bacteroidetes bacterium HGW-Bacteroidetes-21]|jgi:hypothetical protein|nr:MAG: hypothetical protein CVU05_01810 [Bacteroidetes bacterium HGW-Bacteroidetes-21]
MNCDTSNENIYLLIAGEASVKEREELLFHLKSCQSCKKDYDKVITMLQQIQPSMKVQASNNLKSNIMNEIKRKEKKNNFVFLKSKWSKVAAVAAIVVLTLIIVPTVYNKGPKLSTEANAMEIFFNKSIAALKNLQSVMAEFNIRTIPGDNFELIDLNADFVKHSLWKRTNPDKWKIQKSGRTVLNDGKNQYLYVDNKLALKMKSEAEAIGWLQILLNPDLIMENERKMAEKNKAEYNIDEQSKQTILTIKAKALGDYSKSDYAFNSSILESNNTRIYTFDNSTDRLIKMQIFIEKDGKNYLVFDLLNIKYNDLISENTFSITLPAGTSWMNYEEMELKQSSEIKNMKSEEVAKLFFESLSKLDYNTLNKIAPEITSMLKKDNDFQKEVKNLVIINIDKSFKSGLYPGEFVPYEIKFKNGEIKKMNLAIRNDNKEKSWMVDGGF